MSGIMRSVMTSEGRRLGAFSIASRPSDATSVEYPHVASSVSSPARESSSSSTMRI